MMGLSRLATAMQGSHYLPAVQAELDISLEMLRLSPQDNMGVRETVAPLFLRVNKDQECYEFVKWWATRSKDYDPSDSSGFLDIKNADIFEPCDFVNERSLIASLSLHASMLLLKCKVLLDLIRVRRLENSIKKTMERVPKERVPPPEEFTNLRRSKCNRSVVKEHPNLLNGQDLTPKIDLLKGQLGALCGSIDERNKFFLPALLDPESHPPDPNGMYAPRSPEEAQMAIANTWFAWSEIPGILEVLVLHRAGKLNS